MILRDENLTGLRGLGQRPMSRDVQVREVQVPDQQPQQRQPASPTRGVTPAEALGVQQLLHMRGYFQKPLDQAVKQAQRDLGLPVTGQVTPMLIEGLRQRPAVAAPAGKPTVLGQLAAVVPAQLAGLGKLVLGAGLLTGLTYYLSQRREAAQVADGYTDVADPEEFEGPDEDEMVEGEACPYEGDEGDEK